MNACEFCKAHVTQGYCCHQCRRWLHTECYSGRPGTPEPGWQCGGCKHPTSMCGLCGVYDPKSLLVEIADDAVVHVACLRLSASKAGIESEPPTSIQLSRLKSVCLRLGTCGFCTTPPDHDGYKLPCCYLGCDGVAHPSCANTSNSSVYTRHSTTHAFDPTVPQMCLFCHTHYMLASNPQSQATASMYANMSRSMAAAIQGVGFKNTLLTQQMSSPGYQTPQTYSSASASAQGQSAAQSTARTTKSTLSSKATGRDSGADPNEPLSVVAEFRAEVQRVFDSSQEQLLLALSDPSNSRNQLPRVFKRLDKATSKVATIKAELAQAELEAKKAKKLYDRSAMTLPLADTPAFRSAAAQGSPERLKDSLQYLFGDLAARNGKSDQASAVFQQVALVLANSLR
eukprot:m.102958 g.102958  ORF g.102958 m.102958 type:complete len:399 (+) comp15204_c0_seq6:50-1246(+)